MCLRQASNPTRDGRLTVGWLLVQCVQLNLVLHFFLAASVCQFHIQFNCSSCAWVSCLFRVCKCYRSFSVLCARWLFLNPACHNKPAAAPWVFHACATAGVQQSPITLTAKQPYITEAPQTAKRELVVSCDRLVFLRVCGIVNSHSSMTTNACTYRS